MTESDPICGRSCCTRRQNSGFRSGTVCGSNESNTSIHLHYKSHPETKPSASYSSWSVKNPKIPAKASLENPHEAIIDNFTHGSISAMKRKARGFKLARRTPGGWSWTKVSGWSGKCHRNVPNDCDSSWEVWGICFTRTPFSAQTNHIGKLGGRADGLRAHHGSLRRS